MILAKMSRFIGFTTPLEGLNGRKKVFTARYFCQFFLI
jgi:hypothetical protein